MSRNLITIPIGTRFQIAHILWLLSHPKVAPPFMYICTFTPRISCFTKLTFLLLCSIRKLEILVKSEKQELSWCLPTLTLLHRINNQSSRGIPGKKDFLTIIVLQAFPCATCFGFISSQVTQDKLTFGSCREVKGRVRL